MSLALIEESAKEVRRLAIAGSPLAVGDFRLKKLIPPLEQAGAKVPVFAQVARAMGELVNGTEAESAARLLGLGTLLNAILYTQGRTGAPGDLQPLETCAAVGAATRTTARVLKPLVEALTAPGGGRFEVVKSAVERGAFQDLRLVSPAIRALDDGFPEIADLVARKVLPAYGPGIVPLLKAGFDLNGKKSDARRLMVMYQLDPEGTLETCRKALEDGSAEVKSAAIACLGRRADCLPLLLEQATARNKQVRAAALEALAPNDLPAVTKLFTELIKGRDLEALAAPFRLVPDGPVLGALLEEGRRVFGAVTKGDSDSLQRLWGILDCLETRREAAVGQFLLEHFNHPGKLARVKAAGNSPVSGVDLHVRLAVLLLDIDSQPGAEAILVQRDTLPVTAFPLVFRSALRVWTPAQVFDAFSPLLAATRGAGAEKSGQLQRLIAAAHHEGPREPWEEDEAPGRPADWDPRWLDAAVKGDHAGLVCCLARPGHKAALQYLLQLDGTRADVHAGMIVRALVRCRHPQLTDTFLRLVAAKTRAARYLDSELQFLLQTARHLPPSDLPRLDEFAAKLDPKFLDAFLVALDPLRRAGQPATD